MSVSPGQSAPPGLVPTDPLSDLKVSPNIISHKVFEVVLWVGFALCVAASILRLGSRLVCFRKIFIEDYFIVLSMCILAAIVGILHRFLSDIYYMMALQRLQVKPGPETPDRVMNAVKPSGVLSILFMVSVWMVKANFLVFFGRLGRQIKSYTIWWWIAFGVVISCGIVNIGLIPYKCLFGSYTYVTTVCGSPSEVNHIQELYKGSISVDVLSDVVIVCFPLVIVWNSKVTLRQKLFLSAIFLLVSFNIAVTIIRGSTFGGLYGTTDKDDVKVFDIAWMLFWFYMEVTVSILIASIISFRSLWVTQRGQKRSQKALQRQTPETSGMRQRASESTPPRWKNMHTLLDTLHTLEGANIDTEDGTYIPLDEPTSHLHASHGFGSRGVHDGTFPTLFQATTHTLGHKSQGLDPHESRGSEERVSRQKV